MAIDFLEDIICSGAPALLPSEHRASSQLLRMLTKEESDRARDRLDLTNVLNMGQQVSLILGELTDKLRDLPHRGFKVFLGWLPDNFVT